MNNKELKIKTDRIILLEREIELLQKEVSYLKKRLEEWITYYNNHINMKHSKYK